MADGTVVVPQCSKAPNAEMYVVSNDQWKADGTLAANIVEGSSLEVGPGLLLTDGRAFFVGVTGNTALYSSGATDTTVGTWTAGPQIPRRAGDRTREPRTGRAGTAPERHRGVPRRSGRRRQGQLQLSLLVLRVRRYATSAG